MRPYWPYAMAFTLTVTAFAARAEDLVVIDSTAAEVKVGAVVASGASITVPDKARVVLAAESGQIITLTGPFQGVPPSKAADGASGRVLTAISSLVKQSENETSSVGAVRAADVKWRAEAAKSLQDVLAIDVADGGDVCLYDANAAALTRNPASPPGTVTIHAMDGDAMAKFDWPKGALLQPWPKQLPLGDGKAYVIEVSGQSEAAMTTVHILPPDKASSDLQRAAQLADSGCDGQAKLLLKVMAKSAK